MLMYRLADWPESLLVYTEETKLSVLYHQVSLA